MLGSTLSISGPNIVLNTAVAEALRQYADRLEQADDFESALHALIKEEIKAHKRIIFNGNGYDDEWIREAEKRGLLNLKTTPDCLPYFLKEKNVKLFTEHKVFSEAEIRSRYEILMENYCKVLHIEAATMLEMAKRDILPAVSAYSEELARTAKTKKSVLPGADCTYEEKSLEKLSALSGAMFVKTDALEEALAKAGGLEDVTEEAMYYKDSVIPAMARSAPMPMRLKRLRQRNTGRIQATEIFYSASNNRSEGMYHVFNHGCLRKRLYKGFYKSPI